MTAAIVTDLVTQLIELRKARGLTTTQIAEQLHCTRVNIVKFERECIQGTRSPSVDLLARYAAVVGARLELVTE
jgi:transcriptional regulator with XRE-family HTH domain